VGVVRQVLEDLLGSAKWALGVDDPLVDQRRAKVSLEQLRVVECLEVALKLKFAVGEGAPRHLDELASKDSAQYSHREEESWRT